MVLPSTTDEQSAKRFVKLQAGRVATLSPRRFLATQVPPKVLPGPRKKPGALGRLGIDDHIFVLGSDAIQNVVQEIDPWPRFSTVVKLTTCVTKPKDIGPWPHLSIAG